MKIDDLISESEVQQLDELKAGKYAQVVSILGALAAQHGGKAADAATVGWKQQAPHALATLATYADPRKLGALPATLSADELNKGEDELARREKHKKIGRLVPMDEVSLEEGKYNELFLKALVGAILVGGLNYAVDYAKEKTAELDRAGLEDVYHNIDPRQYPELIKKLDPKEKQGLNSIIGKINKVKESNKENKSKKKQVIPPKDRPKMKMSDFDPRKDLKIKEDEKRMSRAGKGVMKYGKDGMKALAKAGRNGASDEKLDKLRDKYDKYDEGVEPDHEATMAKGQLYNACKNAMALMKMIEDGENLEGWVAAKITKASDYLNSVHDYLVYEKKSMSEEKQRLDPKCWTGYRKDGTKMKGGVRVNNCVKVKK